MLQCIILKYARKGKLTQNQNKQTNSVRKRKKIHTPVEYYLCQTMMLLLLKNKEKLRKICISVRVWSSVIFPKNEKFPPLNTTQCYNTTSLPPLLILPWEKQ